MIIDFHTHIFPPWLKKKRDTYLARDATFSELYASPKATMATAEDIIEAMKRDGVDLSVVMGIGWEDHGLAKESNDYIIEMVKRFPSKLVGFAGLNPRWGEDAVKEAERCADAGLRGIGELHPDSQGFDLGNKLEMVPLMEIAQHFGLIVTTHSSEPIGHTYPGKGKTRPEILFQFIQNFPDVTIVCAHWGGGLPFYALMPEVVQTFGNVYFDTAASPYIYKPEVFETATNLVGPERILLGSDFPLIPFNRLFSQVSQSSLSPSAKESITGGNALRLLTIDSNHV